MNIFQLKLGKYILTLDKKFNRNQYMRWYQKKNKKRINAQRRYNYNINLNGQRDRKLNR